MLGGTQSLHTNALDEAIALPTDFSARIARNTQIVLQEETGMTNVVDPLGGSYYVEALTKQLVDEAWAIIERVESEGGMAKAVAAGWPKGMIEEAAAGRQARVDRGEDVIVGVNRFRLKDEDPIETLDIDNTKVRQSQIARIERVRAGRDEAKCQAALKALAEGAKGKGNLLALAVDAARERATLGEISSAMEEAFGRYDTMPRPVKGIYGAAYKDDERYAQVVRGVEAVARRLDRKPRVMVAKMGQDGHDRGAKVIATAFADLGFDVDVGPLFQTPAEVARDAVEHDEAQQGAAGLLVPPHPLEELLPAVLPVGGRQPQGAQDVPVPGDVVLREAARGPGELGREDHPDRDGVAVLPAEVLGELDGVGEGVAVVEELAVPRLAQVARDDVGLDLDGTADELGEDG